MYTVRKKFAFSAAHSLKGLAPEHPCSRQHGHNYEVELVFKSAELNPVGFVRDYRELDVFKKWIDEVLDHRDLNWVFDNTQTSAENLAKAIYDIALHRFLWTDLYCVRVSETPKTWAEYTDGI